MSPSFHLNFAVVDVSAEISGFPGLPGRTKTVIFIVIKM